DAVNVANSFPSAQCYLFTRQGTPLDIESTVWIDIVVRLHVPDGFNGQRAGLGCVGDRQIVIFAVKDDFVRGRRRQDLKLRNQVLCNFPVAIAVGIGRDAEEKTLGIEFGDWAERLRSTLVVGVQDGTLGGLFVRSVVEELLGRRVLP